MSDVGYVLAGPRPPWVGVFVLWDPGGRQTFLVREGVLRRWVEEGGWQEVAVICFDGADVSPAGRYAPEWVNVRWLREALDLLSERVEQAGGVERFLGLESS